MVSLPSPSAITNVNDDRESNRKARWGINCGMLHSEGYLNLAGGIYNICVRGETR